MSDYSEMLATARAELPGAPDVLILRELRRAVARFTRTTHSWVERHAVRVSTGEDRVELTAVADAVALQVKSAKLDGRPLAIVDIADMRASDSSPPATPKFVAVVPGYNVLALHPKPNSPGQLVVDLAQATTRTTADLPDYIDTLWHDAVVSGALSVMKAQADKPWFDLPGAGIAQERYNGAEFEARRRAASGGAIKVARPHRPFV